MTLLADIVANELATSTRFQKLYRTIFNKFLKGDFVHIKDFKEFETKLNARLTTIEANIKAGDVAVTGALTAAVSAIDIKVALPHTSTVPGNPTVPNPAALIPTPPAPPAPGPTTPDLAILDTSAQAQDARQQALGPSAAPLGQGTSPEVIAARIDVKSDIGLV